MVINKKDLYTKNIVGIIILSVIVVCLFCITKELNEVKSLNNDFIYIMEEIEELNKRKYILENKKFLFENENNDFYNINRYTYSETSEDMHTEQLKIMGNDIIIRYINQETGEKVTTQDIGELHTSTLMISTEKESYMLSVPATYDIDTSNNTLKILRGLEQPLDIQKQDGYFEVNYSFYQKEDIINEFWYMRTDKTSEFFTNENTLDDFLFHDLSENIRWSIDGYYFPTPYNYVPGGEDVLYKHPSCLAGISLARYSKSEFGENLGTLMIKTNIEQQNDAGYWETGPISLWLTEDFNINNNFYDTRFNSDFAIALLELYEKTHDDDYLQAVYRYIDFYFEYAEKNSYFTENGGMYVCDYGSTEEHEKTHTSLNHFLVETEVLIRLYLITENQEYADYVEKMFQAIVDTKEDWLLESGNLVYAFYYEKDTNLMIDYLYLTYNDMFNMQNLLTNRFDTRSETLDYLMESKRNWLIENNAHDYRK